MTDKHTPGKWSVYCDPHDEDAPRGFEFTIHSDTYGCVGYWTGHKQNHKDERWYLTEADARLIAAAPDLLASLEMALVWLDYEGKYDVQGIRSAIAKARGQV